MFNIYINTPTLITYLGLILSTTSVLLCINGFVNAGLIFLIWSGICDVFDGFVARRIQLDEVGQSFGLHIDSLADMGSFVVAPAIIAAVIGVSDYWFLSLLLIFYVLAGAMRLAYFNVYGLSESRPCYTGLPVTYIAVLLPAWHLIMSNLAPSAHIVSTGLLMGVIAIAFIAKIPIPKPEGIWIAIFPIGATIITLGLIASPV